MSQPTPEGGLSTRLLVALALTAGGGSAGAGALVSAIRPQGANEVAEAIREVRAEVKELRGELVELVKGMAVKDLVDREQDRRIGKLETEPRRTHKN